MTEGESPPTASAAAMQRIGRIRLPPAKRLWRMARWMVAGCCDSGGVKRSSAASISRCCSEKNSLRVIDALGLLAGAERLGRVGAVFADHLFHARFGIFELLAAGFA